MLDDFDNIRAAYSFGISDDVVSWDLGMAERGMLVHPVRSHDRCATAESPAFSLPPYRRRRAVRFRECAIDDVAFVDES